MSDKLSEEELTRLEHRMDTLGAAWGTSAAQVLDAISELRAHRATLAHLHAQVDQTDPECPIGVALTLDAAEVEALRDLRDYVSGPRHARYASVLDKLIAQGGGR